MNIEGVYAALFALLAPLKAPTGAFKTVSRRLRHVEDVDPSAMPGVYQLQTTTSPFLETLQGIAVWTMRAHWYIYVSAPNMDAPTTPILNPRVEDVLALLPSDPEQAVQVTVGDVVVLIIVDGQVEYFEGLLDTKSIARIPIKLIVPNASP